MIKKYINNRFFILYITPFFIGLLTVFSFQPFNLVGINFFILPIFFYLLVYIKKNLKVHLEKNHTKKTYFYLV